MECSIDCMSGSGRSRVRIEALICLVAGWPIRGCACSVVRFYPRVFSDLSGAVTRFALGVFVGMASPANMKKSYRHEHENEAALLT